MNRLGIKGKLIFAFLVATIIPLTMISLYSYYRASESLKEQALLKVEATRNAKRQAFVTFFERIKGQVTTMAHAETTKSALLKFNGAFKKFTDNESISSSETLSNRESVKNYYNSQFGVEFSKHNDGHKFDAEKILNSLTPNQIALQNVYIVKNQNPLGSKNQLNSAEGPQTYNQVHSIFHPEFNEYLTTFGFYDIFLIDADSGDIVYSVFKELDFATSLKMGPYASSSLGDAFRGAMALGQDDEIYMADFKPYFPSYEAPAGFFSAPIKIGGVVRGVIAFQMPIDKLNGIALQKVTEDKTLETFIVGSDFRLRSDTIGDINKTVKLTFKTGEKGKVENDDIKHVLSGNKILGFKNDYLGRSALVSGEKLDVFGNNWIITTLITEDEALKSMLDIRMAIIIGLLISTALVASLATWYANSLSGKLVHLAEGLRTGAMTVGSTSIEIANASSRLSEASTQQAASLQETVASIDEISAMVQRNADSATSSHKNTEESTITAQKGKEKVEYMLDAINEISKENDAIMSTVQTSNNEISEIVKVIREIADKTKVINDIVFQTKLLSFNASVEAARAGEHGKGFAVVAEEIGNLASMSGNAATEISDMLDKSVQKVNKIVENTRALMDGLVRSSKEKVAIGSKTAHECAQSLDEILSNVSKVNDMVSEITTASREQSSGVREITKAMAELDQVTQANNTIANESSHTANDLKEQAEQLNKYVSELSKIVTGN